jgi:hypothetical protein
VGLILVFSMGVIGTALTALRLWKSVRVGHLARVSDHSAEWHEAVIHFALLSHMELCAIAVCANLPTLAGWLRGRRRRQRTTNRSGSGGGGGSSSARRRTRTATTSAAPGTLS